MRNATRAPGFLFGLVLAAFLPLDPAHAQFSETWVSHAGSEANDCSQPAPCLSLGRALLHTNAGGQINIMDAGNFGTVKIEKSVKIVNDSAGTTALCCSAPIVSFNPTTVALVWITAGPNDVVTLRGLTLGNSDGFAQEYGVLISNAHQVNIEKCTIRGETLPAVALAPNANGGTLASSINLKIEDTAVTGSAAGAKITSVPGVPVNVSISGSSFQNNTGAGIRADGTGGGAITVVVSDSNVSLNASNGILALSGPSGSVRLNVAHSVIASNGLFGVQSNQSSGGTAAVTVNASTITDNGSGAVGSFGGGTLLTFGDNRIAGANGTGFTGPIALQ